MTSRLEDVQWGWNPKAWQSPPLGKRSQAGGSRLGAESWAIRRAGGGRSRPVTSCLVRRLGRCIPDGKRGGDLARGWVTSCEWQLHASCVWLTLTHGTSQARSAKSETRPRNKRGGAHRWAWGRHRPGRPRANPRYTVTLPVASTPLRSSPPPAAEGSWGRDGVVQCDLAVWHNLSSCYHCNSYSYSRSYS